MASFDSEKRDFTRVRTAVQVRYKFFDHELEHADLEKIWDGSTTNLSGGGMKLKATIPYLDWIPLLLTGRMKIGVNLLLPTYDLPVKALCRVMWMEEVESVTHKTNIGLSFREISRDAQDQIVKYIIKTQIPG